MKALAIGYMVSLLFGLAPGQITPTQPRDDAFPDSKRSPRWKFEDLCLLKGLSGRTETSESMVVEYKMEEGAATSLALLNRINESGRSPELTQWTAHASDARVALEAMRAEPALADYTDWLSAHLEDMEVAGDEVARMSVTFQPPPAVVPRVFVRKASPHVAKGSSIPLYQKWLRRMEDRPCPARAQEFLPVLRAAFAAEGVPEALVWLAETESTFNPRARNPVGARGLFQIMPETAKSLGLSLRPHDQRLHPATSARAAARYLKRLHTRFGDWPLALAAYNGGETRVAQALKARGAKDFAGIANHLPAETRLYVPKVLATIQVRSGVSPGELAAPGRR